MAFIFKLQQLLQVALHEENEVKNLLAKKEAQIAELEEKIQKYKDDQTQAFENQQQDLLAGDLAKVQMYPAYMKLLKKSEDFYANEKQLQEKQREKIMAELQEKHRNRRTFEKMREVEEAKYKKEMLKRQQIALDEFGSVKKISQKEPEDA